MLKVKKKCLFVQTADQTFISVSLEYLQKIPCRNVIHINEQIHNSIRKLYLKVGKVLFLGNKDKRKKKVFYKLRLVIIF